MTRVDAHGKHLFLRFEGDLVIHSHLRMTGSWGTYRAGQRWRRSPRRAWLVARARGGEVVQFDGPVLELLTGGPRPRALGHRRPGPRHPRRPSSTRPSSCAACAATTRPGPIGDALLDQRTIAGIGNLWKAEGCHAAAIDPWRPTGAVSDDEALAIVRATRPRMQQSGAGRDAGPLPRRLRPGRAGRARAAARRSCARGMGDDNRTTFWCPACQT